jgi:hypothetical protein
MATEIYTPPQELPVTSKIYGLPFDDSGSTVYEDPNKVTFVGDVSLVGHEPTATVA